MPQAENITVKNGNNDDKTFTLLSPAAGDGGMASWALKEGVNSNTFPTLLVTTTRAADRRNLHIRFYFPSVYTDASTGLTVVKNRAEVNLKAAIPNDFPELSKDDWVAFVCNLIGSTQMRATIRDALPNT